MSVDAVRRTRAGLLASWVGKIRAQLRAGDFAGVLSEREIAVLLCGASADHAALVSARLMQMLKSRDSTGAFLNSAIGMTTRSPDSSFEGSHRRRGARAGGPSLNFCSSTPARFVHNVCDPSPLTPIPDASAPHSEEAGAMTTARDLIVDQSAAMAESGNRLTTWYAQGHSDGLGDRLLMFDNTTAPSWELLRFNPSLARDPQVRDGTAAPDGAIEHVPAPGLSRRSVRSRSSVTKRASPSSRPMSRECDSRTR